MKNSQATFCQLLRGAVTVPDRSGGHSRRWLRSEDGAGNRYVILTIPTFWDNTPSIKVAGCGCGWSKRCMSARFRNAPALSE